MSKRITYSLLSVLALAAIVFGCGKTTIIDMAEEPEEEEYIPRTKADSTNIEDSSRTPISFTVTVEGWKEVER